jgi:hypothetical protein
LPVVSRIIPGDWGKAGPGWLVWPLLSRAERRGGGGRIHQLEWEGDLGIDHQARY